MRMRLRRATPEDAPTIAELVAAATARQWGTEAGPPVPEQQVVEAWRARLSSEQYEVFVAVDDREKVIVGEIAVTGTRGMPTSAHLSSLAVRTDRWGRGVARQLLDHAVEHLRAEGYEVVECWTEADNDRSTRLYEAHGWSRLDATRRDSRTGRRLVQFERRLRA